MNQASSRSHARAATAQRRRAWRKRLEDELQRMQAVLRDRPDVRRVILFGSAARGEARYRSDLDLIVIQDSQRRFLDRIEDMRLLLRPRLPTDVIVYSPEEWNDLRSRKGFAQRVEKEGRVLYAAAP